MNHLLTLDTNLVNDMIGDRVIQIRKDKQKAMDKYTNCIGYRFAVEELNLFDDILFKKLGICFCQSYENNSDLEVQILDMEVKDEDASGLDRGCKTIIKFELENDDYDNRLDIDENNPKYNKYEKIYEYSPSSRYALDIFDGLIEERSSDEEDSSDDEEE